MMFNTKNLALCALLSAGTIFGFGTNAQAQTNGGQGGVSGAAVFIAEPTGGLVTEGSVAGAVGRVHAISQAYLGATPAPAAYAIGTSIHDIAYEVTNGDGVITSFTGFTATGYATGITEPTLAGLEALVGAQNGFNLTYTMYVNSLPAENVSTSPEGVVEPVAP